MNNLRAASHRRSRAVSRVCLRKWLVVSLPPLPFSLSNTWTLHYYEKIDKKRGQTETIHPPPMSKSYNTAHKRLLRELRELIDHPVDGIIAAPLSDEDLFNWRCIISGPVDTPYEYGIFEATLTFPKDYPLSPPSMKFITPILHPNIYKNGKVCISILHESGNDPLNYESADERWGPLQSIEKILLSVSSMIADPNPNSPADVDAAKLWREDTAKYEAIVKQQVLDSLGIRLVPKPSL